MRADAVDAGTLPVLATPFTADGGEVDWASLRRLVDYAMDAGADGLVYPGVASEFSLLTVEERTAAVETVAAAARGRLPVIVGASADDARSAAGLAEHGRRMGAGHPLTPPLGRRVIMSIFTIFSYAMLILVVAASGAAIVDELRIRKDRRSKGPRFLPAQTRRVLPRA